MAKRFLAGLTASTCVLLLVATTVPADDDGWYRPEFDSYVVNPVDTRDPICRELQPVPLFDLNVGGACFVLRDEETWAHVRIWDADVTANVGFFWVTQSIRQAQLERGAESDLLAVLMTQGWGALCLSGATINVHGSPLGLSCGESCGQDVLPVGGETVLKIFVMGPIHDLSSSCDGGISGYIAAAMCREQATCETLRERP